MTVTNTTKCNHIPILQTCFGNVLHSIPKCLSYQQLRNISMAWHLYTFMNSCPLECHPQYSRHLIRCYCRYLKLSSHLGIFVGIDMFQCFRHFCNDTSFVNIGEAYQVKIQLPRGIAIWEFEGTSLWRLFLKDCTSRYL